MKLVFLSTRKNDEISDGIEQHHIFSAVTYHKQEFPTLQNVTFLQYIHIL